MYSKLYIYIKCKNYCLNYFASIIRRTNHNKFHSHHSIMNMVRITCNILYCNIIDQNQYQNILQLQLIYIYTYICIYDSSCTRLCYYEHLIAYHYSHQPLKSSPVLSFGPTWRCWGHSHEAFLQ